MRRTSRCKVRAYSDRHREGKARENLHKPFGNSPKVKSRIGHDGPETGRCNKHPGYRRRSRPPHPKERKTGDHQYPRGKRPLPQKTANASPQARETAVNRTSRQNHAEAPPMKERSKVGGRKTWSRTSKNRGRPVELPGRQEEATGEGNCHL